MYHWYFCDVRFEVSLISTRVKLMSQLATTARAEVKAFVLEERQKV
jgi:hypothetical protein